MLPIGPLVVIDGETLTVDLVRCAKAWGQGGTVVERTDLVVVPIAPGAVGIGLVLSVTLLSSVIRNPPRSQSSLP